MQRAWTETVVLMIGTKVSNILERNKNQQNTQWFIDVYCIMELRRGTCQEWEYFLVHTGSSTKIESGGFSWGTMVNSLNAEFEISA